MPDDIRQIRAERQALQVENAALHKQVAKLEEDLARQQLTLHELMNKTGAKLKVEYQYGEDECRPLAVNSVCEKCGWDNRPGSRTYQMKPGDKGRSTHLIL